MGCLTSIDHTRTGESTTAVLVYFRNRSLRKDYRSLRNEGGGGHTHEPIQVSLLLYVHPQIPYGLLGTGSPGRPPRLSHGSWALDCSSSMLLYVHRDHTDYSERGAHLDFHTAPELSTAPVQCCFMSTETIKTVRDFPPPPIL